MKAEGTNLFELLQLQNKQFVIPIYQRTYRWEENHCKQLWKDILRAANDPGAAGHFIGSIVYIQGGEEKSPLEVSELQIIDGQQRLVTVSLLLASLAKYMEKFDNTLNISQKINEHLLFNKFESGDLHYRLKPTKSDRDIYFALLDGKELPKTQSRIIENYNFFEKRIFENSVDLVKLYQGISKLMIVSVSLKYGEDDPQRIFESLNSTGLGLSKADLIRNFFLMGLDPKEQEDLYINYWSKMEKSFFDSGQSEQIDRFIRDYLTIMNGGIIPAFREVYAEFQRYVRSKNLDIKDIMKDIYKYSGYYIKLSSSNEEDDIGSILKDIKDLRVDVAYTFLMEIYDDFCQKMITREEFIEILKLIESYVFRRAICGIPPNSLNKTFATLSKELAKNREHYLESFKAALMLKESNRRFPDDDEFKREMMVKDLYHFRNCRYYLTKLEKPNANKAINVNKCTVEHIMPQTLSDEWKEELGENWAEIHSNYLHNIGNLTLAAYNTEYSNRPFLKKRDLVDEHNHPIGLGNCPLRLNNGLGRNDHWNEHEIRARAQTLAEDVIKIWPYPQLLPEILAKYRGTRSTNINCDADNDSLDDDNYE